MVWIAAKNNFAEPRLRNALQLMATHTHERLFWYQMIGLLAKSLLLLVPIAGLIALLTRTLSSRLKLAVWGCWLVGVVVLTVLNVVQSAHYIDQFLFIWWRSPGPPVLCCFGDSRLLFWYCWSQHLALNWVRV